jgi:hypothetical protein
MTELEQLHALLATAILHAAQIGGDQTEAAVVAAEAFSAGITAYYVARQPSRPANE